MRNLRYASIVAALAVASGVSTIVRDAHACAVAMPRGGSELPKPIEIHREDALIVWNEATKTEDFIRRAVFDTTGSVKSFGFLVPTPSRPTLTEASPALFDALQDATKPEVIEKTDWDVVPALASACVMSMAKRSAAVPLSAAAAAPDTVQVLEETHVAGMDATVLAATDADALAKWLGVHGYDFRPALRDWLKPYVDAGYTITAFQYARPDVAANANLGAAAAVSPTAVRLSFKAEKAFYPYREPSDAPEVSGRTLHLFTLSTGRPEGVLGAQARAWGTTSTPYSDALAPSSPLLAALGGAVSPQGAWLTEMVDTASRRESDDVFLRAAPQQTRVRPPPIERIVRRRTVFVPLDLMLLVTLAAIAIRRRVKRKRDAAATQ